MTKHPDPVCLYCQQRPPTDGGLLCDNCRDAIDRLAAEPPKGSA